MAPSLYRVVLPAPDMDRSDAFWSHLLQLETDALFPTRRYLKTAGAILALVDPSEHDQTAHPAVHPNQDCVYVRVPDLDAAYERAVGLGADMPTAYPGTFSTLPVPSTIPVNIKNCYEFCV